MCFNKYWSKLKSFIITHIFYYISPTKSFVHVSKPLVSIIIPTYNRAHLISETLDSILAQTFKNWECIVVDDGSTDATNDLLKTYCDKDSRFVYVHRPNTYQTGGNGARNYGFEISKGAYIQWFDDDDVMLPEHIATKVAFIEPDFIDFVISKSKYLNSKEEFYHYNFKTQDITFESFSMGNVSWVTDDYMIKRAIALKVSFNELLRSGQEYNYCCKFLLLTEKGLFINDFLTYRRDSDYSIGKDRRQNRERYLASRFQAYWLNYLDISRLTKHHQFDKF